MTAISEEPVVVGSVDTDACAARVAAGHGASRAKRHLIPSLSTLTVLQVLMFAGIFLINFFATTDPDLWWHLATGRYIVESGTVPTTDPFSYTATGRPWIAHEWLAEIPMYLMYRTAGYLPMVIFFAALVTATYGLVYRTLRTLGADSLASCCVTFWIAFMSLGGWNVRPQVFSYLFFALYLYLLVRARTRKDRWIWALPVVMVPWVNLHAGYVMGLLLPGLFIFGEAINLLRQRGPTKPVTPCHAERSEASPRARSIIVPEQDHPTPSATSLRRYVVVTAGTVLATIVNPQGPAMLLYPLTYAGTQNASMRYINEWQSPNFHDYFYFIFAASMMVLMVVPSRRRLDWAVALPVLVLTAMSLQSVRVITFYAIGVAPLLALRLAPSDAADPILARRRGNRLNWALLAVALAVFTSTLFMTDRAQLGPEPRTSNYPVEGVRYLREAGLNGNLFNTYHWGGYLAWSFYPERRVFIDGRADMYGDDFMEKYKKVYTVRRDWDSVVAEYDVGVALVEKDSAAAVLLSSSGTWREVFRGGVESIFARPDGDASTR